MGRLVKGILFPIRFENLLTSLQEFKATKNDSMGTGFEVKIIDSGTARAKALRQPDAALGRVIENRLLTKPGIPVKRHIGS